MSGVVESHDAVLARDVLAHPACRAVAQPDHRAALQTQIDEAGLGLGSILRHDLEAMAAATRTAGAALSDLLGVASTATITPAARGTAQPARPTNLAN